MSTTTSELALTWRKSSHSGPEGDACIEVAARPGTVHVRDSKDADGARLAFAPDQWTAFVGYAAARA
ncbi:DUF397 domain-containing protein [Streptomyces sp. NBC_01262]|uniref:DUF397 domain-containing protein n=1 Tax=Streptomyces sp. NBC_01262 TaxID=2903803 RepID=UPI002E370B34|nr:DUF397 domain-containing protein [Streptomyces sp. NBC_01262]